MLKSRVFMRFSQLREKDLPHVVYRTEEVYMETVLVRGGPSEVRVRQIWASPTGLIVFENDAGELQELTVLRSCNIPARWDAPVGLWMHTLSGLELVTIKYCDDRYEWIVKPCLNALDYVRRQTLFAVACA